MGQLGHAITLDLLRPQKDRKVKTHYNDEHGLFHLFGDHYLITNGYSGYQLLGMSGMDIHSAMDFLHHYRTKLLQHPLVVKHGFLKKNILYRLIFPAINLNLPDCKSPPPGFERLSSGKRSHNHGKIHHAINGKTHYFYGHFQKQTVSLPEGTLHL